MILDFGWKVYRKIPTSIPRLLVVWKNPYIQSIYTSSNTCGEVRTMKVWSQAENEEGPVANDLFSCLDIFLSHFYNTSTDKLTWDCE